MFEYDMRRCNGILLLHIYLEETIIRRKFELVMSDLQGYLLRLVPPVLFFAHRSPGMSS